MWADAIAVALGLALLALGGFFALLAVLAMLERRPVRAFLPCDEDGLAGASRYVRAMAGQARQCGYASGEPLRQAKHERHAVTGWASYDIGQRTLAVVASGPADGRPKRCTLLISRLDDRRYLVSSDAFGEADASDLLVSAVLSNADFFELERFHRERAARLGYTVRVPLAFAESSALEAHTAIQSARVARTVERGRGRYLDAAKTTWRYTASGALRMICRTFNPLAIGAQSLTRVWKLRPGDAHYRQRADVAAKPFAPVATRPTPQAKTHTKWPANVSWNTAPVAFTLRSPHVAVFDPAMLDVLRDEAVGRETGAESLAGAARDLAARERGFACVACFPFRPGAYSFDPNDLERLDAVAAGSMDTVAVDTGAVLIADVTALPVLAAHLDWTTYEAIFHDDGDQIVEGLINRLGGAYFALAHGDPIRRFSGEGLYRVHARTFQPV
mgnify:CR=1 FL=1